MQNADNAEALKSRKLEQSVSEIHKYDCTIIITY